MADREKVIKGLEYCTTHYNCRNVRSPNCPYLDLCKPIEDATGNTLMRDALALLNEYEQSEQSYLRTLVELSNERDKLLKELGREDEHKYKDGSFMAGGNGIVKL